ncbi:MAG: AAA family ATPase [Deltaproteobacteria bacterium]|nr:AAA family ATPase [Deltaproteobacteria bacterium]
MQEELRIRKGVIRRKRKTDTHIESESKQQKAVVVSFINLKGGVGKTTLCLTIGEILSFAFGKRVLLIDLDSQSNLSSALVPRQDLESYRKKKGSIYHLFLNLLNPDKYTQGWDLKNAVVTSCSNIQKNNNLNAILSLPELGQFDEELADALEKGGKGPAGSGLKITIEWRKVLNRPLLSLRSQYDYILIDCPPSLSLFTSNALVASDYFVTPISPEYLSIQGLELIQNRLGRLQQRVGTKEMNVRFAGCIINRIDIRRKDHVEICRNPIYSNKGRFLPFRYWVGDLKPMYIVTDYYYPSEKIGRKWVSIDEKYNYEERNFRNPDGVLNIPDETDYYDLYDRLYKLTKEFMKRCR